MTVRRERPITGRHVLVALIAMFTVVLGVNGVFAWFAIESHPGVITEDSYVKGLHYNDTLADIAAQRARGWRPEIAFTPKGRHDGVLSLRVTDRDGAPVTGLSLEALVRRPVSSDDDRRVAFAASGNGVYRARLALPRSGNWDLIIDGARGGARVIRLEHRLWMD